MDLSQIPIHQRLDALLERLDENVGDEENLDYLEFVDRRAQNGDTREEDSLTQDPLGLDDGFEDAEVGNVDIHSRGPKSSLFDDVGTDVDSDSESVGQRTPTRNTSSPLTPSSSPGSGGAHLSKSPANRLISDVYREAGVSPRKDPIERHRRKTTKQVQREIEQAARENQEMERTYGEDVGMRTVKPRTVSSFLADLEGSEDEEEPNTRTENTPPSTKQTRARDHGANRMDHGRVKELLSSPPRMQGLRSFISTPVKGNSNDDDANNSDSDLEIIPETRTNRLSKPVKNLLKFSGGGGGTSSDRKLVMERAKLLELQRKQIAQRRSARLNQLREHGVDVDDVANKLSEKRQVNAMSGQLLLERERERAEALKAAEYSGSDSESELEFDDAGRDDQLRRARRILSDSDSDHDDDNSIEDRNTRLDDVNTNAEYLTTTERDISAEAAADTDAEEEEEEAFAKIGRTGTQYVPPLPQHALAEMLGTLNDDDGENEGVNRESDKSSDENPDTLHDEEEDFNLLSDDLNIIDTQTEMRVSAQPDLSDLKNKDLTLSQHLAEVRQRYLRAQEEQRRKESLEKRNSKKRAVKSAFVEDQAEESDDEENGGLRVRNRTQAGDDDDADDASDEDQNIELAELVDHEKVSIKETELKRRFLEEEKLRDQKLLNKMVDGVHGGFRRQRQNGQQNQFLSDDDMGLDDNDADDQMQQYLRMIEAKRKNNFVSHNASAGKLATNTRAAAFFTSISEDFVSRPTLKRKSSVQESLEFLRSVAEKDSEALPEPQQPLIMQDDDTSISNSSSSRETNKSHLPSVSLSVRRTSTLRMPGRAGERGSTYASRISATELGNAKTVEIMQTLGQPAERNKPKKRFVAPSALPVSKRPRKTLATVASANSRRALFKRSWA